MWDVRTLGGGGGGRQMDSLPRLKSDGNQLEIELQPATRNTLNPKPEAPSQARPCTAKL